MRLRGLFLVAALAIAFAGSAFGQKAAATTTTTKLPAGLSLAFDAPSGQLTASGLTFKAMPKDIPGTASFTGTVNITITINLVSKIGHDSRVPCAAILIGGEADTTTPVFDGGIETASTEAAIDWKSKTATCTLSIPFEWTLVADATAAQGMFIGIAAGDVDHAWGHDVARRSTIQIGGPLPLPASGSTTTLAFTTTL